MADRIIIELCDGWALGYDQRQWIILRRRNTRTQCGWKSVAFIATEKRVLRRVLREKGISPNLEAAEYIDAMPDTFRAWLRWREASESDRRAA